MPLEWLLATGEQLAQGLPNGDPNLDMTVTHTLSSLTGKLWFCYNFSASEIHHKIKMPKIFISGRFGKVPLKSLSVKSQVKINWGLTQIKEESGNDLEHGKEEEEAQRVGQERRDGGKARVASPSSNFVKACLFQHWSHLPQIIPLLSANIMNLHEDRNKN